MPGFDVNVILISWDPTELETKIRRCAMAHTEDMRKTVALSILMTLLLASAAWGQGKIQADPDSDADPGGNPGVAIARSNPAAAGAHALKLVGAASSNDDVLISPNDLNTDERHIAGTSVAVDIPADPARTYWFVCTGAFVFWEQVPSASPLLLNGDVRVRLDTVDGAFAEAFRFEGIREFDTSTRHIQHTAIPARCSAIDQTQFVALFVSQGLSEADALAKAQEILRSDAHLTVTFFARMRSVSGVDFSGPILQVWSD
jgi:hypothetical protein